MPKSLTKNGNILKTRRTKALEFLQSQLDKGMKTAKRSYKEVPLTELDVKRIKKEISSLQNKIL